MSQNWAARGRKRWLCTVRSRLSPPVGEQRDGCARDLRVGAPVGQAHRLFWLGAALPRRRRTHLTPSRLTFPPRPPSGRSTRPAAGPGFRGKGSTRLRLSSSRREIVAAAPFSPTRGVSSAVRCGPVGGGMGQVAGLGVLARVCAHAPSTPATARPFLTPPAAAGQTSPMRPRRSRASLGLGDARAHCPKCLPILNPDPHGTWILPRAQVQARCDVPHCHRPRAARRPSGQGREGQKNDQQQPRQWPGPLSWPCSGPEHPHIQPVPTTQPSCDGAPTRLSRKKSPASQASGGWWVCLKPCGSLGAFIPNYIL